jgi:electron transport complex protein RnfC
MGLNPALISQLVEKGRFDEAVEQGIMDCFECGSCAFVCPSRRPVVHYAKWAKREIARKRQKA